MTGSPQFQNLTPEVEYILILNIRGAVSPGPQTLQVMVANIRCGEIAADQLAALVVDQAWCKLHEEAEAGLLRGFGARVGGLLGSNLAGATPGL